MKTQRKLIAFKYQKSHHNNPTPTPILGIGPNTMTMMRILKVAGGGGNAHILLAIRIKWTDLNNLMQINNILDDFDILKQHNIGQYPNMA